VTRAQVIVYTLLENDSLDSYEGNDTRSFFTFPTKEKAIPPYDRVRHWNRFYAGTSEVQRRFDRLAKRRDTIARQNHQLKMHKFGQIKPGEGI
jgi:hypothetical protein